MKKLILLLAFTTGVTSSFSQEWRDPSGNETLESVRQKFHQFAEKELKNEAARRKAEAVSKRGIPGNAIEEFGEDKVKGFKQFKRWEYFWETRVLPDGTFPAPDHTYNEYMNQKNQRVAGSQSSANWTHMGPTTVPSSGGGAGRVNCIAFHPTNSNTIWVGSPAGGLWKSTDGGTSWTSNTDLLPNLGVSDIAINPQNPQIMYIATGDGDGGDNYSIGILKSTDGGMSWTTTGMTYQVTNSRYIYRLLIDPVNPNVLIAGCNNGIWRSADAGATWSVRRSGNVKDIEIKPGNPSIMYAISGSNMLKSVNNGVSWVLSNSGFPTSGVGRTAIAVTPADTNVVYALISKPAGTGNGEDYEFHSLYKSSDGAATWTMQSDSPNLLGWSSNGSDNGGQGWYDLALAVSETNADVLFVGGVNLWKSTNGGTTWSISAHWYGANGKPYVHADAHMLKFAPNSGTTLYACVDGGVFKSTTTGTSWSDKSNGLQIMQFYKIGSSVTNPARVLGGSQDNGTNMILNSSWERVIGGDGMECLVDHSNDQVMFGELYYGDIRKSIDGGNTFYSVMPAGANDGAWVTPYVMDPNDHDIMYLGLDEIYKSYDNGDSWIPVTTGLSNGSLYKMLAVAKANSNYVYASTGGSTFKSTDGGTNWTSISTGLPGTLANYITVKPSDANTVYITLSGYTATQKVYMTTNAGATWVNITATGLPNTPINCIEVENNSMTGIYVGTDLGVYYRNDTMTSWIPYNNGLPNVIVNELEINYLSGKLRAGTYGRGLWESDLFTNTITSLKDQNNEADALVYYPNPAAGMVTIENLPSSGTLELVNETGQVVFRTSIQKGTEMIDVSSFASGIYFLKVSSENNISRKKIVVKN